MEKADGCQRMTVGYCRCNYVVTPIAAVISDVESLPGKINTVPDTWEGVIDLANVTFCIARSRKKSETLLLFVRVIGTLLPSCLGTSLSLLTVLQFSDSEHFIVTRDSALC